MCALNPEALRETLRSITLGPGDNDEDGSTPFFIELTGEVPPVVYHYTSADAVLDIITRRELWASHARFVNDTTEISHGLDLILTHLHARGGSGYRTHFVDTVHRVLEQMVGKEGTPGFDVYVACFSDGNDIIPQWKGYASDGAGYALGFDLVRAARLSDTMPLRVIYDEREQRLILDSLVDGYLTVLDRSLQAHPDQEEETAKAVGLTLTSALLRILVGFKQDMFSHEREWRLVEHVAQSNQKKRQCKFRSSRGVILPYIELSLGGEISDLPVSEIRCGPTSRRGIGLKGAEMLIRQLGLPCKVTESAAPLRY